MLNAIDSEVLNLAWLEIALAILVFAGLIVRIVWQIYQKGLHGTIVELIQLAEEEYGSGTGRTKMQVVINRVYDYLPRVLKLLITEKMIEHCVQKIFDKIKEENKI